MESVLRFVQINNSTNHYVNYPMKWNSEETNDCMTHCCSTGGTRTFMGQGVKSQG